MISCFFLVFGLVLLLNLKCLPFVFHIKFFYIVFSNFYARRPRKPHSPWEWASYSTWCAPFECDFNMHKSNSTYFSDADMSRSVLLSYVMRDFYLASTPIPGAAPLGRGEFAYSPLGSVSLVFKHQIAPFQRYQVKSRIFGWTEKWLFVLCVFRSSKGIHAFGLFKYVFKHKRQTIRPALALKASGLWSNSREVENASIQPYLNENLDLETIEKFI